MLDTTALDLNPNHTESIHIPMSYEEYLEFDHTRSLVEWVNGEAIIHMSPIDVHQHLAGFLFSLLSAYAHVFNLGTVMIAPFEMCHMPGYASREPDILFIRHDHQQRLTRHRIEGAADLIVEVISPDSVTRDTRDKFQEYRQTGVQEYWILDPRPRQQTLVFYHLTPQGDYAPLPPDNAGCYHSRVLAGFWLDPVWLWQTPLPFVHTVLGTIAPEAVRDEAALQQAETRGRQAGLQQGLAQGLQQGRQQGRIETVLRLLTRRCGALDATLVEQVHHLSTPQLDALTEALLDFTSSADLTAWLDATGQARD
jgi:Uma2 family endonuclease